MTVQLQPHRNPSRRVSFLGSAFLIGGTVAVALGVSLDGGAHSTGRYISIGGLVVAVLGFFVAVGFWIQSTKIGRALAEMEAGAILGDWHAPAPMGSHVQVGPKLALVGGKVRSYAVHLQAVTDVAFDDENKALIVRATVDAGYGPIPIEVRLPGSPNPEETRRCARDLAQHHGIAFDDPNDR